MQSKNETSCCKEKDLKLSESSNLKRLEKGGATSEKPSSEIKTLKKLNNCEEKITNNFIRDEDLQNLLLHYMKLTVELRQKNSHGRDETSPSSDETIGEFRNDDCPLRGSYETEDENFCRKPSFMSPSLQCQHCPKILRGIRSLKNHCMRKHGNHEMKNVLCDKCPTRFFTDFEFNRHYQTHYSIKNFLCDLCSKKFFLKSSLELHLRYHKNDRRYQCDVCRKKFFTKNHLKRHCLTHTNQKDFKCEPCDRSFRYKDHLKRHLQSVHIGVRPHCCQECSKSFMYLSQLKFHKQSHTNAPLNCKHCRKNFKKRISLRAHQRQCKK